MLPSYFSLDRFVYPLNKVLRWDVENVDESDGVTKFGKSIKIGKAEWCLLVQKETLNNEKYLGLYLHCLHEFEKNESIHVECQWGLINHLKYDARKWKRHCTYKKNSTCRGIPEFMKWTSLVENGYLKNGTLIVLCEVIVLSENFPKTESHFEKPRPNSADLKLMLSPEKYQMTEKVIEKEIELSQISEDQTLFHPVYMDGFPCYVSICKKQIATETWLDVFLHCNTNDKSEWWTVEAGAEFKIKNRNETKNSVSKTIPPALYQNKNSVWGPVHLIKWSELIDPKNGYVKYGRIIIETEVSIRNKYGFDENTGKGIEKQMKRMTDAVVSVEGEQFHVSRMILSHHSEWFCDLFSSDPDRTHFVICDVEKNVFVQFLQLVYNRDIEMEEDKFGILLELLDKYRSDECIRRLDYRMMDMEITDDMGMLKLIDKHPLLNMKRRLIEKLKDLATLRMIFRDPDVIKLSDQLREELMLDEVPESEEEDLTEPYFTYSKQIKKPQKIIEPREKMQKFFVENNDAKKLLEDPELQNVGNDILWFLGEKSENSKPEFGRITFKEFSDPSDMVIFNLEDGNNFYSSKQILANQSGYFMKRFFGPDAKDDDNTIVFDGIPSNDFNLLLNHVYHPTKTISDGDLPILCSMAHRFSITSLLEKCENHLILSKTILNVEREKLEHKYNFQYLRAASMNHFEFADSIGVFDLI